MLKNQVETVEKERIDFSHLYSTCVNKKVLFN